MSEADTSDRGTIVWEEGKGWRWRYVPDRGEVLEGYASTRDDALIAIGAAAAPSSLRPTERRIIARGRWGGTVGGPV